MGIKNYKVIGLMSGSSLDGLDIAYCHFQLSGEQINWTLLNCETIPFPEKWQVRLAKLPEQNALIFAKTHTYFGHYMAELVNDFIARHEIEVDFIASHGHTIFHYPNQRVTVQIGDGAALAALTGLPVVNNFRTHDIALDGEGTPLAPIADKLLFPEYDFHLNIGGIANITCGIDDRYIAFDVGPANQVLNILANQLDLEYDAGGAIARKGQLNHTILEALNEINYFAAKPPKSLDNQWIKENIVPIYLEVECPLEDKLRTACEHLAFEIMEAVGYLIKTENLPKKKLRLLATGGGAFNTFLMECIHEMCNQVCDFEVVIPSEDIVSYKEALLMGLMGVLRVENKVNCLKTVTGAIRNTIGGSIYQGKDKFV